MSQERLSGNSNAEPRTEPNHPQQAEEVTTTGPTPNRFWRMMTDPGFPPPASNPASFVVTAEAFLGLTNQVRSLASMMESPMAPNREIQLETEVLQRWAAEVHVDSPTAAPVRSRSHSGDPVQVSPDLDTLSSDSADSLREQVRQVHQRLDRPRRKSSNQRVRSERAQKVAPCSPSRYKINPCRPTSDSQPSNSMTATATQQNTSQHFALKWLCTTRLMH
ncbi:hypothetical protein B296_00041040 [Ensete ventricosum]|uniref:Uncharacterized protein n=1 Tax=Ensete ventricosum TaxID=4639 RepID=A0A426ZNC6_ENSVE|nr:hypothetical protein B296_00041040 [Ensete ventricosum]